MNYNNKVTTALIIALFTLLIGCFLDDESVKGESTGNAGDVVVVMDSSLWSGGAGEQVRKCLSAPQEGLPQSEALFNLIEVTPKDFTNIFKVTRNIIVVEKEKSTKKASYVLKNDLWANNQLALILKAENTQQAADIIAKNCEAISDRFRQEEWHRLQKAYAKLSDQELMKKAEKAIGIKPVIPNDFVVVSEGENHIWIRKDYEHKGHQVSMGLMMYKSKYDSVAQLDAKSIMMHRNEMVKKVEGPVEGSYMSTYEEFPPVEREMGFDEKYVKEFRGLWNMKGAFMGGPFVHYSFIDESGRFLIDIDAYVFAPKFDKREYLRELEAISLSAVKG